MEEYRKQFVLNLLAYAVQRNISPSELCRLSGIDFKALRNSGAGSVTSKQFRDLWLNAIHLANDPAFGLHFGESLQLSALGAVGQIIESSNTVGEALLLAAKSVQLVTDKVSMEVSRTKKSIVIRFFCSVPGNEVANTILKRHLLEFFMVFAIHEMDGLVLEKIKPVSARFNFHESVSHAEYERVLRCKPRFLKGDCILEFEPLLWDVPIITGNYDLQRHLLKSVNKTGSDFSGKKLMRDRILNYLTVNAYLGVATLEEVAFNFNISSRTLQRKLHEEGSSFQELADSIRKSIALDYLQAGNYPVKEISYILGYNELSAFTRAFKRWTGCTPMDYRKKINLN
jgi:AraC-like DNA-binding protein